MLNFKKGYSLDEGVIVINRELTELDLFVKKFLDVLNKHSDYLIVSGFVSISTGRVRGTEDVDIIVPKLTYSKFNLLFNDLINAGFWCYQGDDSVNVYKYVKDLISVRFAVKDNMFPNIELILFDKTNKIKYFEFNHPQKIKVDGFEFKIPQIEFEILYKEIILKSEKDLADAKHLRTFFSDILDSKKLKMYEKIIQNGSKK